MTWTDLSGAFGYGTKLTSQQQCQLRDNATHNYDFLNSCSLPSGDVLIGQTDAGAPEPKTISNDTTIDANGVVTITDNAVTTAKINDLAVTPAKLSKASASTGYWDLIKNENYVPAAGIYILANNSPEHIIFEILISGVWYGTETVSGMYNFDGSTRRITNTSDVITVRVYYHIL